MHHLEQITPNPPKGFSRTRVNPPKKSLSDTTVDSAMKRKVDIFKGCILSFPAWILHLFLNLKTNSLYGINDYKCIYVKTEKCSYAVTLSARDS